MVHVYQFFSKIKYPFLFGFYMCQTENKYNFLTFQHIMYDINFSLNALHAEQKFQQTTFWNIFLMFPRKQALAFHANWLLRSQFAWNSKAYFLENVIKMLIINLSSAELAQREMMVNGHEKATDQGEKPLRLGLNFINKNTLRENIMEKTCHYFVGPL